MKDVPHPRVIGRTASSVRRQRASGMAKTPAPSDEDAFSFSSSPIPFSSTVCRPVGVEYFASWCVPIVSVYSSPHSNSSVLSVAPFLTVYIALSSAPFTQLSVRLIWQWRVALLPVYLLLLLLHSFHCSSSHGRPPVSMQIPSVAASTCPGGIRPARKPGCSTQAPCALRCRLPAYFHRFVTSCGWGFGRGDFVASARRRERTG